MEEKRREGTQRVPFQAIVTRWRSTTTPCRLSAVPHIFGHIEDIFLQFFSLSSQVKV